MGPGRWRGVRFLDLRGTSVLSLYEMELIKLKLDTESSAHILLLCSESGHGAVDMVGSSWQDIWLSSNRSSGGGDMLNTGLRFDGVFCSCCTPSPDSTPLPTSPPVLLDPPVPLLGAESAASIPCISDTLAPSPPAEWRCGETVRCSEAEVEPPLDESPMAREEEAEGLEVEELASVVAYTDKVSTGVQHRAG